MKMIVSSGDSGLGRFLYYEVIQSKVVPQNNFLPDLQRGDHGSGCITVIANQFQDRQHNALLTKAMAAVCTIK